MSIEVRRAAFAALLEAYHNDFSNSNKHSPAFIAKAVMSEAGRKAISLDPRLTSTDLGAVVAAIGKQITVNESVAKTFVDIEITSAGLVATFDKDGKLDKVEEALSAVGACAPLCRPGDKIGDNVISDLLIVAVEPAEGIQESVVEDTKAALAEGAWNTIKYRAKKAIAAVTTPEHHIVTVDHIEDADRGTHLVKAAQLARKNSGGRFHATHPDDDLDAFTANRREEAERKTSRYAFKNPTDAKDFAKAVKSLPSTKKASYDGGVKNHGTSAVEGLVKVTVNLVNEAISSVERMAGQMGGSVERLSENGKAVRKITFPSLDESEAFVTVLRNIRGVARSLVVETGSVVARPAVDEAYTDLDKAKSVAHSLADSDGARRHVHAVKVAGGKTGYALFSDGQLSHAHNKEVRGEHVYTADPKKNESYSTVSKKADGTTTVWHTHKAGDTVKFKAGDGSTQSGTVVADVGTDHALKVQPSYKPAHPDNHILVRRDQVLKEGADPVEEAEGKFKKHAEFVTSDGKYAFRAGRNTDYGTWDHRAYKKTETGGWKHVEDHGYDGHDSKEDATAAAKADHEQYEKHGKMNEAKVGKIDKAVWSKAEGATVDQYGAEMRDKDSDKFYAITMSIYKKMKHVAEAVAALGESTEIKTPEYHQKRIDHIKGLMADLGDDADDDKVRLGHHLDLEKDRLTKAKAAAQTNESVVRSGVAALYEHAYGKDAVNEAGLTDKAMLKRLVDRFALPGIKGAANETGNAAFDSVFKAAIAARKKSVLAEADYAELVDDVAVALVEHFGSDADKILSSAVLDVPGYKASLHEGAGPCPATLQQISRNLLLSSGVVPEALEESLSAWNTHVELFHT